MKGRLSVFLLAAALSATNARASDATVIAQLHERAAKIVAGSSFDDAVGVFGQPFIVSFEKNGTLVFDFGLRQVKGSRVVWIMVEAVASSDGTIRELQPGLDGITQWISQSQFRRIKKGMPAKDVIRLLGEPEYHYRRGDTRLDYSMRSCDDPEIGRMSVKIDLRDNRVVRTWWTGPDVPLPAR